MRLLVVILFAFPTMIYSQANQPSTDWGNLERFHEANKNLKDDPERIIFYGNSITQGWADKMPDFFQSNPNFVNRGIGGQTTPQMLIRFRQDVLDLNPKAVVILAGINDIAQNTGYLPIKDIFGNTQSMSALAKDLGIRVVLCSVLPAYDFPWRPGLGPIEKVKELNQLIEDYCAHTGTTYVDYYSAMVDEREGMNRKFHTDEVHPNAAGYAVMKPLVLEGIRQALAN